MAFNFENLEIKVTRNDYSEKGFEEEQIVVDDYDIKEEIHLCGYDVDDVKQVNLVDWNAQIFVQHRTGKRFYNKWLAWTDFYNLTIDGYDVRNQALIELEFEIVFNNDERENITIHRYTNFSY